MNKDTIAERYEVVKRSEDGFVCRTIVKDLKAHGKLRTILSVSQRSLGNPNVIEWFNSQSALFSGISSDYVVDFIDRHATGEIMDSPTLVIEEPGTTLADLMTKGAIQPAAALGIVTKVLMGVHELHELGFLHLDIRPETIGVNSTASEVKLLSLGNCTPMSSDAMTLAPNSKYAAPECYIPDARMDRNTDIYSVGFLFYELLCGKEAFSEQFASIVKTQSNSERKTKWTNWHVSDKEASSLNALIGTVDEKTADCVHKMIDKAVENRFSSASTVINELKFLNGGSSAIGVTGEFNTKAKKRRSGATTGFFGGKYKWWKVTSASFAGIATIGLAATLFLFNPLKPKVTFTGEELEALVTTVKSQRRVVDALALNSETDAVNADVLYNHGFDAYDRKDHATMYTRLQESQILYGSLIDKVAPVAMADAVNQLRSLQSSAKHLDVEGLTYLPELSAEYESMEDLEKKYTSYSASISAVSNGILVNNRLVEIGSSKEEIENAFSECKDYSMACERSWYEDEALRTTSLAPFELDKMEVTVAEFKKYIDASSVITEVENRNASAIVDDPDNELTRIMANGLNWKNAYKSTDGDLPVVHITQSDAIGFCKAGGKRLPTEAEWEYSARGHQRLVYPWGNEWDESKLYWAGSDIEDIPLPAGSFLASSKGFHDLAGSVSEWTSSTDASGNRVYLKGASRFESNVANIRAAVRRVVTADYSGEDVGFRCATDLDAWPLIDN